MFTIQPTMRACYMHACIPRDVFQLLLTACRIIGPRTTACMAATCKLAWRVFTEVISRDPTFKNQVDEYCQHFVYAGSCYDMMRKFARGYEGLKQIPMHERDHDMCLAAVKSSPSNARFVPTQVVTHAIARAMLVRGRGSNFTLIPNRARTLEICQLACEYDLMFGDVPKKYRAECAMSQVKHRNGLLYMKSDWQSYLTEAVYLEALKHHNVFCIIPTNALTRPICLAGCVYGGVFPTIPPHLLTREMCTRAVQHDSVLAVVPKKWRTRNLCKLACKYDCEQVYDVPTEHINEGFYKYLMRCGIKLQHMREHNAHEISHHTLWQMLWQDQAESEKRYHVRVWIRANMLTYAAGVIGDEVLTFASDPYVQMDSIAHRSYSWRVTLNDGTTYPGCASIDKINKYLNSESV